ncbi:MAG: hypothetical protein FWC96_06005 [Oscillospiraceae bacterium]|nr:hypothetical protein [Oscillospiraceae bacterium]
MANVKIKKIRILVSRADKDVLLREFLLLGCMEILDTGDSQFIQEGNSDELERLRAAYADLTRGLDVLKKYSTTKKSARKKQKLARETLLDESETENSLETARKLIVLDTRVNKLGADEKNARSLIESLTPWAGLDIPLDHKGTQSAELWLGTIPVDRKADSARIEEAVYLAVPESQIIVVSSDKTQHYLAIVYIREKLTELAEILRGFNFFPISMAPGTAAENIKRAEDELKSIGNEREEAISQIAAMVEQKEALERCCDHIDAKMAIAGAAVFGTGTESSLMLTGWMTASSQETLIVTLSKYKCAWEIVEPLPEDGNVPSNRRFFRGDRPQFMPLEIKTKYVDIIKGKT